MHLTLSAWAYLAESSALRNLGPRFVWDDEVAHINKYKTPFLLGVLLDAFLLTHFAWYGLGSFGDAMLVIARSPLLLLQIRRRSTLPPGGLPSLVGLFDLYGTRLARLV